MSALGVGRSTLRESIGRLVALGVLEARHGNALFVATGKRVRELPIGDQLRG